MKFVCDQGTLNKKLNIISKAVPSRTTLPILQGILLEVTNDGELILSASDLDMTIESKMKVENFEPGSVVVKAKLFSDIIRKYPSADILFEEKDNVVTVKCLSSTSNLIGVSEDEFPNIKNLAENETPIKMDAAVVRDLINKTSFAASIDSIRGVLTGILTELRSDELRMVTVDGFRVAIAKEPMVNTEEKKVIINAKLMNELSKIISEVEYDGDLELYLGDKKSIFVLGDTKIEVRLLDGQFSDYERFVNFNGTIEFTVDRRELLDSIERASIFNKDDGKKPIVLNINDNVLVISSKSTEGDGEENVLIEKTGDNLQIGFNARYLKDVLKVIDDDRVLVKLKDANSACIIEPVEGDAYKYLVLPMRI